MLRGGWYLIIGKNRGRWRGNARIWEKNSRIRELWQKMAFYFWILQKNAFFALSARKRSFLHFCVFHVLRFCVFHVFVFFVKTCRAMGLRRGAVRVRVKSNRRGAVRVRVKSNSRGAEPKRGQTGPQKESPADSGEPAGHFGAASYI